MLAYSSRCNKLSIDRAYRILYVRGCDCHHESSSCDSLSIGRRLPDLTSRRWLLTLSGYSLLRQIMRCETIHLQQQDLLKSGLLASVGGTSPGADDLSAHGSALLRGHNGLPSNTAGDRVCTVKSHRPSSRIRTKARGRAQPNVHFGIAFPSGGAYCKFHRASYKSGWAAAVDW